jgi:hypothetical protein
LLCPVTRRLRSQHPILRRLLAPVFTDETKIKGPGTPAFKMNVAPAPAAVNTATNVKVERPYFSYKNTVPGQVVTAAGDTSVKTWDGAKFAYSATEEGTTTSFDTGKRAFEYKSEDSYAVNFPQTQIAAGGGNTFAYTSSTDIVGPVPNTTAAFTSGDGPSGSGTWAFGLGPGSGRCAMTLHSFVAEHCSRSWYSTATSKLQACMPHVLHQHVAPLHQLSGHLQQATKWQRKLTKQVVVAWAEYPT